MEAKEMVEDNLSAFYSRGVPVVDLWMAVSFFAKMKYHQVSLTSPWTIMYLACLVVSFFVGMEMNMMIFVTTRQFKWRWMVAYLSTILRISAATALMLFFNTTDTATVLVLFGLALVLVIYLFRQMFGPGKFPGLLWRHFKELLNRRFEESALVVAPSVAGLSGKVLGYVKGSSNLTTAAAPECFLFYSAVSGLLAVLFCTVPPSLSSRRDIRRMAKVYVPILAYMALSFFVVATVVAAEKILQEYVYLAFCPIVIFALLLYLCDAEAGTPSDDLPRIQPPARRSLNDERRDEARLSKYIFTAGISPILLAIMAIHSSYSGIGTAVPVDWPWKAFVSLAVCSILSHPVRIVILAQMTEENRYEIFRKIWTAGTYAAITATALFAVLVMRLHPDEFKSIFL